VNDRDRFHRFTERARNVLSLAQEEAQRFNHRYVGTEHLLLGLIRVDDGVAAKVLSNLGVELNTVRHQVESIIGPGDRNVPGDIGLTPRAKKVIELAVDEAQRLNHHYIGTEHLLLGLVREGEGVAVGVLESLGVNIEKVRTQTIQVLSQTSQMTDSGASDAIGARTSQHHPLGSQVPSTMNRPTYPECRDLVRVIAIGQSQQHEELVLSLLALEVYADGCLLTTLLQRARAEPMPHDRLARLGQVTVTMTDDRGGVYTGELYVGSSSSVPEFWQGRAQCACTPTLDPAARALRIEIPAVQWSYLDETEPGDLRWLPEEIMPGPWIYSVRFPTTTA